ncbi:MAG: hypothetical protein U9N56_00550 [Actinomycetota bacterium]|nr:hypothetical protein [Actinomycetota bacterium]
MRAIPLHDLDAVATKADIKILGAELRTEMAKLRADLTAEIASVRKTISTWMLTLLVAIIGAMVSIVLIA